MLVLRREKLRSFERLYGLSRFDSIANVLIGGFELLFGVIVEIFYWKLIVECECILIW